MLASIELGSLATIRTPLAFRDKAPEDVPDGNAMVFSIKDLVSGWPFDKLPHVQVDESRLTDAVALGDVLMPGRGTSYPARLFERSELPLFPAGQIHVIRPDPSRMDPRYLCWFLNRKDVQENIRQMLTGSTIKALNKSHLQSVRIEIPSMDTQLQIARLQSLIERRSALRRHLEALEHAEFEIACRTALAKEAENG